MFSVQELARLRGFPEITSEELIRFFTLTSADEVFLGAMRRPATGAVRRRHLQDQTEQAWCLTIATNAISTWTAEYLGLVVRQFRDQGRHIDDEILAHISPAQSQNIGLFGTITVDIDAELAQLGPTGHQPLRQPSQRLT